MLNCLSDPKLKSRKKKLKSDAVFAHFGVHITFVNTPK